MTVDGRKYSLPSRIKNIMRFQETFPTSNSLDPVLPSKRSSRSLTPSPTYNRRLLGNHTPLHDSGCHIESISEDDITNEPILLVRSNSWSGCRRGMRLPHHIRTIDSHRSSTASLADVIEEQWSEEEEEEEDERSTDYMRCSNCNQSNLSTSLDSISSENSSTSSNEMSYCYKCKHLVQGKLKTTLNLPQLLGASDNCRWSGMDPPYSPRTSRKNSGNELSIISEPTIGEEPGDNEEAEKIVNNEVEKLIKFKNKKNGSSKILRK